MEYVELEKLLDKSGGSLYKLVVLASKRALELAEGKPKLVGNTSPECQAVDNCLAGDIRGLGPG